MSPSCAARAAVSPIVPDGTCVAQPDEMSNSIAIPERRYFPGPIPSPHRLITCYQLLVTLLSRIVSKDVPLSLRRALLIDLAVLHLV
jgi:hypothetical protein